MWEEACFGVCLSWLGFIIMWRGYLIMLGHLWSWVK